VEYGDCRGDVEAAPAQRFEHWQRALHLDIEN
jgi:hypothetical protein